MALWDMIKKGAEEGLEALKEGVTILVAEAGKQSKVLRKKMELSSIQSNVRKTFIRLGSAVYDLHQRGEREVFSQAEVKGLIDQIEGHKARVREIELEIEAIKHEEGLQAPSEVSGKGSAPPLNSKS